ncbi:proton-coupled zinc antiporter SLC30A2-like [Ruditapes philippinarum]|uniref:proton-coupled zinc antiporter SLC30A2-like n=1 Tax=Ruditapes philippinarum TaxID=129788 RepID=UPI00295A9EA3|nr:proton-coupled zinc antiporter SLC30A2-like [Ruditapes philippinarum]
MKMADDESGVQTQNRNARNHIDIAPGRRRCSSCSGGVHDENKIPTEYESLHHVSDNLSSPERHCHESKTRPDIDKIARRKLLIACVLSLTFMIAEVIGGVFAHSLAIVSDAAHLLTDLASFLISLLALYLASRRATKKLSFGWYRAEILGALVSILFLWVITGVLCYMAVERVVSMDFEVDATVMLITAACGVAFNIVMGCSLHPGGHGHSHSLDNNSGDFDSDEEKVRLTASESIQTETIGSYGALSGSYSGDSLDTKVTGHSHKANINVKAAFIHVLGDLLQSVGVLVAAFIIYFKPEWKIADPICTFVFSVIVLITTFTILRDILVVLMEGTPRSVNFKAIYHSLKGIAEVKDIHDLRIWSLSMDKVALSVHLAVSRTTNTLEVLERASNMIRTKFGITETTIQVEEHVQDMLDCTHCRDLPD